MIIRQRSIAVLIGLALVTFGLPLAPARAQKNRPSPQVGVLPIVVVGKPAPAWTDIQWADGAGPTHAVEGKTTIVMTFVTNCPNCEQVAPDMLKQLSTAIEDKPVVVVAACTDKGAAEGKAYLVKLGMTGPNVFYGAAPKLNETFNIDPKLLWGFAYIGPNGIVKKTGQSISSYNNITPKKYVLPYDIEMDKKLGTLDYVEASMSATVKPIVWQLELGDLSVLQKISQSKTLSGLNKEDQDTLKELLTKTLDSKVESIKSMSDGEMPAKIEAFEKGNQFLALFKSTSQGKEVAKIVGELNSAPGFKKELAAKKLFQSMVAKAAGNEALKKKLLQNVTQHYPGTYYGDFAKSNPDGAVNSDDTKSEDIAKSDVAKTDTAKSDTVKTGATPADVPSKKEPAAKAGDAKGDGAKGDAAKESSPAKDGKTGDKP